MTGTRMGVVAAWLAVALQTDGEIMSDYPIQPITFDKVAISEGFWAERLETNRKTTVPACFKKCEETGRIHNFEVAGGLKEGGFKTLNYFE